jgi:cytoskeleton protein RodZ
MIGAELARARSRLGLSVEEIGASLRIRPAYLAALEHGRLGDLPGSAYALAFLRAYAAVLGLDAEEMARRLKAEATTLARKTDLAFPAPAPERGLPGRAAALLAVLFAIGVYAGWYRLSGEGRLPSETVTPVPARLAPLAERAAALIPPVASATPADRVTSAEVHPASDRGHMTAIASESPQVSPGSAAAATPVAALSSASIPRMEGGEPRLAVRASADSWLQVRQRGGAVVFSRVMHAGETWPVPAQPDLLLTTGNAGGTLLVVDGIATAPLGVPGAVRRDVPLDPDQVRAGNVVSSSGGAAAR